MSPGMKDAMGAAQAVAQPFAQAVERDSAPGSGAGPGLGAQPGAAPDRVHDSAMDTVFRTARSQNRWLPRAVPDTVLRELYELLQWGPTSMNCSPMRVLFLRTDEAKQRLAPALAPANVDKVVTAPVVAVVAYDMAFHEQLPRLFPHRPQAGDMFRDDERLRLATAVRNGTLQGAYLMVAARMLGLDCGPLSGFNEARVNEAFFAGTSLRVNFLCCLGHGDPAGLFPRHPRLPFEDACSLL